MAPLPTHAAAVDTEEALAPFFLVLAMTPLLVLAPLLMQERIPRALELALALAPLAMELLPKALLLLLGARALDQVLEQMLEQVLDQVLEQMLEQEHVLLSLLRGMEFPGPNLALDGLNLIRCHYLGICRVLRARAPLLVLEQALVLELAPLLALEQVLALALASLLVLEQVLLLALLLGLLLGLELIPLLALALALAPLLVLVQVPVPLQALALAVALAHLLDALLEALLALHWEVSPSQVENTMLADQRGSAPPLLLRGMEFPGPNEGSAPPLLLRGMGR